MKKKKAIRTLIEIDEVFPNVEPGHFFVVRIFGIPIARFNQMARNVEEDEEDGD